MSNAGMTEIGSDLSLEQLKTWQKAMDFAVKICRELLPAFPEEEKYALISQLRRAVQSIPANIAEGHGRYYFQEAIHFCYIARGSLEETRNHLIFAREMGYLSDTTYKQFNPESELLRKMINGYIAYLKKSKRGASEYEKAGKIHEATPPYEVGEDDLAHD